MPRPLTATAPLWRHEVHDHVVGIDWTTDGALVAAASVAGPVAVFSAGGDEVTRVPGHSTGTATAAWRPGDRLLATGGQDGHVRLWNEAGEQVAAAEAGAPWVEQIDWSRDGSLLAIAAGRHVRVVDPAGNVVHTSAEHPSTVLDVAWRPTVKPEIAAAAYGGARLWRTAAGETRTLTWKGSVLRVAWSPDGRLLATGDQDATAHLWLLDRSEDMMMSGFETKVLELAWDASSRYLATGGGETIAVWDCSGKGPAGRRPLILDPEGGRVTTLAFGPARFLLAAGTSGGDLCIYDIRGRKQPVLRTSLDAGIAALAWSPSGDAIAVGDRHGAVAAFATTA